MLDEEFLRDRIGDAATTIEIPDGATERILVASRASTPRARACSGGPPSPVAVVPAGSWWPPW